MSLVGYAPLSPLDLFDAIDSTQAAIAQGSEESHRHRQMRAQAYAQVCGMHKIGMNEMTPSQKAYAEAVYRRMAGESGSMKTGGFSLPTHGRHPNYR